MPSKTDVIAPLVDADAHEGADDASQGEIRQNMPLENQSEPRKKGLKHGFKH